MNADQFQLSVNAISDYIDGKIGTKSILKITNLKLIDNLSSDGSNSSCYRVTISDGIKSYSSFILNPSLNKLVVSGDLKENTVVYIKEIVAEVLDDQTKRIMLIINDVDILQTNADKITYLSKDVEKRQSSNNGITLQPINNYPTVAQKAIAPGRSSFVNVQLVATSNQSETDTIENKTLVPIADINPYNNKWYIKGIVTNKTTIHHYNNARGEGTVFSFDFLDDTDEIRVTVFNNDCNRLYSTIHIGRTYEIAKAIVKPVNRQYNKLSSNYEIFVTRDTTINDCSIDAHLHAPPSRYNFVQLCDVQKQPKNSVFGNIALERTVTMYVIGIINATLDPCVVTNNTDHKSYVKRTIHLIDETGSVSVTLWQEQATNFHTNNKSILAFEGIKVHDFGGCRCLSTTPTTYLKYNPIDTNRTQELKQWFKNYSEDPAKHAQSPIIETYTQQTPYKTLIQAMMEYVADHSNNIYFLVKATCINIDKNSLIYEMCPVGGCAKKVIENNDKQYYCTKCRVIHSNFKWGYMTTIQISDSSIIQPIMVFNQQAELLIGLPASEIAVYFMNNNNDMMNTILSNIINHEYVFKICVQNDRYKNQMCMICIGVKDVTESPSMIGRVATKISNFFHDDDQNSKNAHSKRSVNSISPPTPITPDTMTDSIDRNTIVHTCQSLKKMKIDTSNEQNKEDTQQFNLIIDVAVNEMNQVHSDEVYHASLLPLSSSSSRDQSPSSDDEILEGHSISNIQEISTTVDYIPTSSTILPPMFVSVGTQTISNITSEAFTQTKNDPHINQGGNN